MDPLSITASAITLLGAVNEVISFCYDYKAALSEQPWGLSRILSHLQSLNTVLQQIEALTTERADQLGVAMRDCLAECNEEIEDLHKVLAPSKLAGRARTHRHAAMRALGWKLNESAVEKHLEHLDRLKSLLTLNLVTVDTLLMSSIKESADSIETNVIDIKIGLETRQAVENDWQLHQWLCAIDMAAELQNIIQERAAGTGQWLLGQVNIKNWLSSSDGHLWMSGCSGVGKTVLCSSIIEAASEISSAAFFFCDFRRQHHVDTANILGCLLSQLARKTGHVPAEVQRAFRDRDTGGSSRRPTVDLLQRGLSSSPEACIIVDAIDEVEDAAALSAALARLPVKVLISSQMRREIADELEDFSKLSLTDHAKDIEADIEIYVQEQLSQHVRLRGLSPHVKEDVAASLNSKSAGMFRWTQCQLKTISASRNVKQIRNALSSLPQGLGETYSQILRRVPEQDKYLVRKLLLWLAFSVKPMLAEEVREAIAIHPDEDSIDEEELLSSVDDVLTLCGSLVAKSSSGHLTLAHSSCLAYLTSTDVPADLQTFALAREEAYRELVTDCLSFLKFGEFSNGACQTAEDYSARLSMHPIARHIATTWPYYARGCGTTDAVLAFLESKQHFMAWVQLLNGDCAFKWGSYPQHATPLYYAATFGLRAVIEQLIESSPNLDAPGSRYGGTALHGAAYRGHEAIVAMLLEAGADPNRVDWHQVAPLHSAADIEHEGIVSLLLDYGASPKLKDVNGRTPIDWASRSASGTMLKLLEQAVVGESPISRSGSWSLKTSEDEDLQFWSAPRSGVPLFQSIYDKRSGLDSSIVVSVEIVSP